MKKLSIFVFLTVLSAWTYAQKIDETTREKFTFGVDLLKDIWQDLPDQIDPKFYCPNATVFCTYNFPIGESNFNFSSGLGLSTHNLFSDAHPGILNDSTIFTKWPDTLNFKKSKLAVTYLDIPLEVRFKAKNGIRFSAGLKYGFLMKAQYKYKGDDPADASHLLIMKEGKLENFEKNRYGFIARFGYGWVTITGYYSLSKLFSEGNGPEMFPVSVGISIMPY